MSGKERSPVSTAPKRLWRDQRGIAAVEFALIAPIMLLTYLSATDLTQALAIDRKLSQVAATVSDLVAQEEEITRSEVQAFFEAGVAIMRPFDFDQTKLRLTIVEVDGSSAEVTGTTHRNWAHEGRNGQSYGLPDEMMSLSDGRYAVIASASYAYQPMFGTVFNASVPLEQRSVQIVRRDVDDFGFPMDGFDDPASESGGVADGGEGSGANTGNGGSGGGGSDNCAGNSGGNGQGNNCNGNHNSNPGGNNGGGNSGGNNGNGNNGGGNGNGGNSGGGLGWLRCLLLGIC